MAFTSYPYPSLTLLPPLLRNNWLRIIENNSLILCLKPLHSITGSQTVLNANAADARLAASDTESRASKNDEKVHTINTYKDDR